MLGIPRSLIRGVMLHVEESELKAGRRKGRWCVCDFCSGVVFCGCVSCGVF